MIQEEFRPILEELEAGRSAVLHRTVDGVEYTRLFRPRERLILFGRRPYRAAALPHGGYAGF